MLDALIEDNEKKLYNIEIQIEDKENDARRIRYYTAVIDWSFLKKGADYKMLPELYMIFISRYDNLGGGKNHYEVEQHIKGTDTVFDDGIHKLLFNTAVDDGTELSMLLQYLENSDPNNNNFGALSQAVNYHKINNEGVDSMCKAVEEYANKIAEQKRDGWILEGKIEGKLETIKNLLKKNIPLDIALECAELDYQTYKKYEDAEQ